MAGTITHYKIGKDIANKLNIELNKDIYLLACQGHDLLYFIKLYELPKFKNNSSIVDKLQDTNFNDLVINFERHIIKNDNIDLRSFFYGYITHHIVDSIIHPFIIYHTGEYLHTKDTKKYQGKHAIMESVIDALLVDNINNIYKEIPKYKRNIELEKECQAIFGEVYSDYVVGKALVNNMQNVRPFLRIYRSDKIGVKRYGYLLVDRLTPFNVEFLSFNYPKKYITAVNLSKKSTWYNPRTNEEHNDSILDLYEKSIDTIIDIIMKIDKSLNNKKEAKIDLDISAIHGGKCNIDYKLKYFKY